jgi:hypothetical protein
VHTVKLRPKSSGHLDVSTSLGADLSIAGGANLSPVRLLVRGALQLRSLDREQSFVQYLDASQSVAPPLQRHSIFSGQMTLVHRHCLGREWCQLDTVDAAFSSSLFSLEHFAARTRLKPSDSLGRLFSTNSATIRIALLRKAYVVRVLRQVLRSLVEAEGAGVF